MVLLVIKVIADIFHHTRADEMTYATTEIAQSIRAPAALIEDLGLLPRIHMETYNHS